MDPQRNIERPVGGNFQNQNLGFENAQPVGEVINPVENFNSQVEARERAFSAVEKFSQNFENAQPMPQVQAAPILPPVQDAVMAPAAISSPSTAKDIDLMEDEWVKDLKKMIVDTKGDPRLRQSKFREMQVDYLKKRYNRIIGGK